MHENIAKQIESILTSYSGEQNLEMLLQAKKHYFELTGVLHEDDEDYENKMSRFNDWFIFEYHTDDHPKTAVEEYFEKNAGQAEYEQALRDSRYSLFEFTKINFRKHIVLKDLVKREKIILAKNHPHIGVLEGDIFSGRIVTFNDENFLLPSLCLFPQKVRGILSKHAKKVGKLKNKDEELNFLLKCESLKTKSTRYAHIDLDKIYVFGSN